MRWRFAPRGPRHEKVVACAMRRNLSLSRSAHAIAVPGDGFRRASSEESGGIFCPKTKENVTAHVIGVGPPDARLWEFMQYSMYGNASMVPLASNLSIAGWFIRSLCHGTQRAAE
jgi:hypothetical protein